MKPVAQNKIAIIGGGNIGLSLAKGLVKSGKYKAKDIIITRRSKSHLSEIAKLGFEATDNNKNAITSCKLFGITFCSLKGGSSIYIV